MDNSNLHENLQFIKQIPVVISKAWKIYGGYPVPERLSPNYWIEQIREGGWAVYLAVEENGKSSEVVGCMALKPDGESCSWAVLPRYQRMGIGSLLAQAMFEEDGILLVGANYGPGAGSQKICEELGLKITAFCPNIYPEPFPNGEVWYSNSLVKEEVERFDLYALPEEIRQEVYGDPYELLEALIGESIKRGHQEPEIVAFGKPSFVPAGVGLKVDVNDREIEFVLVGIGNFIELGECNGNCKNIPCLDRRGRFKLHLTPSSESAVKKYSSKLRELIGV